MSFGMPDPRDNIRTPQGLAQDRATQINLANMNLQQIIQELKKSKNKRERKRNLKAFLSKMGILKSARSKSVSSDQAAAISAAGNDVKGSAGDTAKASVK